MKALTILILILGLSGTANAAPRVSDRSKECRYSTLEGNRTMNEHEARLTVACVIAKSPVPGGVAKADCIIGRESGWFETARNASGASGLMQILVPGTWHSWTSQFSSWRHQHHISTNVLRGRPNLLVGLRAASQWGWGSWSTAGGC